MQIPELIYIFSSIDTEKGKKSSHRNMRRLCRSFTNVVLACTILQLFYKENKIPHKFQSQYQFGEFFNNDHSKPSVCICCVHTLLYFYKKKRQIPEPIIGFYLYRYSKMQTKQAQIDGWLCSRLRNCPKN